MQSILQPWNWLIVAGILVALAACGPEDGRIRGTLGADINNRPVQYSPYTTLGGPQPIQPHSKLWSNSRP